MESGSRLGFLFVLPYLTGDWTNLETGATRKSLSLGPISSEVRNESRNINSAMVT